MAGDSVSAHVAAQQKKWENYLAEHSIETTYRDMTSEMISEQPESPVKFMFEYLKRNFPNECGVGAAVAEAKSDEPPKKTPEPAADDEEDAMSDEDDEDDYADFVPLKANSGPMKKRGTIVAEKVVVDKDWVPPVYDKAESKAKFLMGVLHKLFFLAHLTKKEVSVLVDAMKETVFQPGTEIIRQGEEGDMFYIVEDGNCDIDVEGVGKVMEIPCPDKNDASITRRYFGELALLYDAPRAATVKARGEVTTWALDRGTFKSILQDTEKKKIMLYSKFIQSVPIFQSMTLAQTNTLCNSLVGHDYTPGDVIITAGDIGNEFFIIETGEAECFKVIDGVETCVAKVRAGDFFGELALQFDEPRAATVKATSDLSCVKIDRSTFKRMIGNLQGLKKDWNSVSEY